VKLLKESLYEKFSEQSDPIKDMGIGEIDANEVYENTYVKGLREWEDFLNETFVDKTVRFYCPERLNYVTINVTGIGMHYVHADDIWFFDDNKPKCTWNIDVHKKLYIEK